MLNEGNQIHNFTSSSGSGTVINCGSGFASQKVTVPVPQHCLELLVAHACPAFEKVQEAGQQLLVAVGVVAEGARQHVLPAYPHLRVVVGGQAQQVSVQQAVRSREVARRVLYQARLVLQLGPVNQDTLKGQCHKMNNFFEGPFCLCADGFYIFLLPCHGENGR